MASVKRASTLRRPPVCPQLTGKVTRNKSPWAFGPPVAPVVLFVRAAAPQRGRVHPSRRIDDRPVGLDDGALCEASRLQTARPHDVKHRFPAGDEMVGDDATVATPPYRFRTHDRAA